MAGEARDTVTHYIGKSLEVTTRLQVVSAIGAVDDVASEVQDAVSHHGGKTQDATIGTHVSNAAAVWKILPATSATLPLPTLDIHVQRVAGRDPRILGLP